MLQSLFELLTNTDSYKESSSTPSTSNGWLERLNLSDIKGKKKSSCIPVRFFFKEKEQQLCFKGVI